MKKNKHSKLERYVRTEGIINSFIVPVGAMIIGGLLTNIIGASWQESLIISLLLSIFASLMEHNLRTQSNSGELSEKYDDIGKKIEYLQILSALQEAILKTKHPYFRRWSFRKLENFLEENREFFDGTNRTTPHSEDTFGIGGIQDTEKYGSIKGLSTVSDYWDDSFAREYLKVQKYLIDVKKVEIVRIFVLEKNISEKAMEQMKYQLSMGIDVYYIYKDNPYINNSWLLEDYLIQDDKLLVQIFCETHKFTKEEQQTEIITVKPSLVQEKVERFNRILERSEKLELHHKSEVETVNERATLEI